MNEGYHLIDCGDQEKLERFRREKIYVSVRGDVIRVSPHVYNDESDIERLLSALRACL